MRKGSATQHRRGGTCHSPPWGHGRGGSLPRPTAGPWQRWDTATALLWFGVPALPYVVAGAAAGALPPQRRDVGPCQQHLQGWKRSWGTKGSHLPRSIPLSLLQTREEGRVHPAVLTAMPPPQTPGTALAWLLMCPSSRYLDAPAGKSSRMLAATESVPSTSRQGPTIRLHFPTHMAVLHGNGEEEEERKGLHLAPQRPKASPPRALLTAAGGWELLGCAFGSQPASLALPLPEGTFQWKL